MTFQSTLLGIRSSRIGTSVVAKWYQIQGDDNETIAPGSRLRAASSQVPFAATNDQPDLGARWKSAPNGHKVIVPRRGYQLRLIATSVMSSDGSAKAFRSPSTVRTRSAALKCFALRTVASKRCGK